MERRRYKPSGATTLAFHQSRKFVRGIRGPIGSGKTVAACMEIFRQANLQEPSPIDGWRRTRWGVIRNTYRQLETSTIKTWIARFPEHIFGKFKWSPPFKHIIRDEANKFEAEFWFLALDNEDNTRDLLSTEWTGFLLNEAREFPKKLVDDIISRARRYPEMAHGGPTHPCVVMDTNAPPSDHWWAIMSGECPPPEDMTEQDRMLLVKPDDWEFFTQPSALVEEVSGGQVVGYSVNPKAENLANLHPDYYARQWQSKTKDWIDVYLMNRYKISRRGKPVYTGFNQDVHIFKRMQEVDRRLDIFLGVDFGLTPAAVLLQRFRTGRYQLLYEWVALDMTIPAFGKLLAKELAELGLDPGDYDGWGDPAGDIRDHSGDTAFQLMRAAGVPLKPTPTNDPSIRIGAVQEVVSRLDASGKPMFGVNPSCTYIINGFVHGYHYRKLRVKGDRYEDQPEKNKFSHPHDALQYALLGAGEGRALMVQQQLKNPVVPPKSRVRGRFGGRHERRSTR